MDVLYVVFSDKLMAFPDGGKAFDKLDGLCVIEGFQLVF